MGCSFFFVRLMHALLACTAPIPAGCLTFFCPCVTFGRIAGIVDQGATSCCASGALYFLLSAVTGLGYLYSCGYRSKLWARRRALRRLLRPPLLRGLRALPGVPRAQGTRLRHVPRMGGEHGEDGESRRCSNRLAPHESRDVALAQCVRAAGRIYPCTVSSFQSSRVCFDPCSYIYICFDLCRVFVSKYACIRWCNNRLHQLLSYGRLCLSSFFSPYLR